MSTSRCTSRRRLMPCLRAARHGLTALAAALLLLGGAGPAPAGVEEDRQLRAYVSLLMADEARDAGEWEKAYAAYGEALELYRSLAEEEPRWQPEIVQYRIRYCTDQQAAMAAKRRPAESPPDPEPPGRAAAAAGYQEQVQALKGEIAYLRRRIRDLEDELDRADTAMSAPPAGTDAGTGPGAALSGPPAAYEPESGTTVSNLEAALAAVRMEHAEAAQANRDLVRQLEAAAEEHLRLTEALERAGLEVPLTRGERPGEEEADLENSDEPPPPPPGPPLMSAPAEGAPAAGVTGETGRAADELLEAVPRH